MEIVFFFKPIVDLLYQYKALDIILCILCFCYLFINVKPFRLCNIDCVVFALVLLFTISYFNNLNGLIIYIKIISAFLLYFLGRLHYIKWPKLVYQLQKGFLIVWLITLYSFITKEGFISWGNFTTFTGYYFFKTDLAAAIAQSIVIVFAMHSLRKIDYAIMFLCIFFILLSNARMYYFITFIILGIIFIYNRKPHIRVKFNPKLFLGITLSITILLILMNSLNHILGDKLLLFDFKDTSDLMSGANTQGRNIIWERVYRYFNQQDFITRLFGVDLVSDTRGGDHNAHSLYLKILFSIGYVGSILYIFFFILAIKHINSVKSNRLYYITACFTIIYLLSGISNAALEYSQLTWLPMFFIGTCVSESQCNFNRSYIRLLKKYSMLHISQVNWFKSLFKY